MENAQENHATEGSKPEKPTTERNRREKHRREALAAFFLCFFFAFSFARHSDLSTFGTHILSKSKDTTTHTQTDREGSR